MHLTADLPGTGGVLRVAPEDFFVEELPAYEPSGAGDHLYLTIEKRGLSTPEAIRAIAQALGVREGDVGSAGMKDRQAVTRQRLSVPAAGVAPERALGLDLPGLRVLAAARHGNKLKTGHLRGNRFVLRVRGLAIPPPEAARRAEAILARLARPPGLPNWYGEQRFGTDNVARGRALVRGETCLPPPRDPRERRFLVSAFQSELFNRYLEKRLKDDLYDKVITGDLMRKVATGGLFTSTDAAVDQPRLEAGEIAPTGPMFGHDMRGPTLGSEAAAREAEVLAAEGIQPSDFRRVARLAEGTRRPIGVPLGDPAVRPLEDSIELCFFLPPGAYATVLAGEVIKN